MIYCEKENKYIEQEKKCILCIFYKRNEDSCFYGEWNPGLKKGKDTTIEEIGHA